MAQNKGQTGMSLVEATIILLVLMLLSGALAPSIFDFLRDVQMIVGKEDCEAIGLTVVRLVRDVGSCPRRSGAAGCTLGNRAEILYSEGPAVTASPGFLGPTATNYVNAGLQFGILNWNFDNLTGSSMTAQFVTNTAGYATPAMLGTWNLTYPAMVLGWRGAYLSPPIGPDPWGRRYLVNSAFLAAAIDAPAGTAEGLWGGGWDRDVLCLSAGPNQLYETPIGGSLGGGTMVEGDDFVYVISGGTR